MKKLLVVFALLFFVGCTNQTTEGNEKETTKETTTETEVSDVKEDVLSNYDTILSGLDNTYYLNYFADGSVTDYWRNASGDFHVKFTYDDGMVIDLYSIGGQNYMYTDGVEITDPSAIEIAMSGSTPLHDIFKESISTQLAYIDATDSVSINEIDEDGYKYSVSGILLEDGSLANHKLNEDGSKIFVEEGPIGYYTISFQESDQQPIALP